MTSKFTDKQIARLFDLCAEVALVRKELPTPPRGFDVGEEQARNLRVSLTQHDAALAELHDLLSWADENI